MTYVVIFFLWLAEKAGSESSSPRGEGVPSLSQPPHPSGEENSNSSTIAREAPRVPEEPDLADRSSQSSINSQDDQGVNGEAGGKRSAVTPGGRMVTRLRNPESKLSQLKSKKVEEAVNEANKGYKEGKEVITIHLQIILISRWIPSYPWVVARCTKLCLR